MVPRFLGLSGLQGVRARVHAPSPRPEGRAPARRARPQVHRALGEGVRGGGYDEKKVERLAPASTVLGLMSRVRDLRPAVVESGSGEGGA